MNQSTRHPTPPVVVVHAITGAVLVDTYRLPHDVIWQPGIFARTEHMRLAMHPENLLYEAQEPARVQASHPVELIYRDFIDALRHDLSPAQDRPTPVYAFTYDWRQDNAATSVQLGAFIQEVIERTNLLRHYRRSCDEVDLVGHSMGGLVIAGYLAACLRDGKDSRVRRVVTLGTPYQGSVDSLTKLTSGESDIVGKSANREREAARMIPSLYQLLPTYADAFLSERRVALNLYEATNWQTSVVASISEFVRIYSIDTNLQADRAARTTAALRLLQSMLDNAKKFHQLVATVDPRKCLRGRGEGAHPAWLVLVGKDRSTRWQAQVDVLPDGHRVFRFVHGPDHEKEGRATQAQNQKRWLLGDETVPLVSSVPPWADPSAVVCVRRQDFGRFEFQDKLIGAQAGLHATLPLMNLVQRWVVSFLRGQKSGDLWGRALPGVKPWRSPVEGAELRPD